MIAELDAASGAVKRRYVPGPGTNEVVAWYEGSGVGERRFIHQDERGSVVAVANGAGAAIATFRYGPWGESTDTAFSRFGYTGAIRLPGTDLLHMRARVYATELARFLEPDPIGFASGQLNLYAYVGGDPVNAIDPFGLKTVRWCYAYHDPFSAKTVTRCTNVEVKEPMQPPEMPPPLLNGSDKPQDTGGSNPGEQAMASEPDGMMMEMMGEADKKEDLINGCSTEGRVVSATVAVDFFVPGYPGFGITIGVFRNLRSGQIGFVAALDYGIGVDISAGFDVATAGSAASLEGTSIFAAGSVLAVEGQVSVPISQGGVAKDVVVAGGVAASPLPAGASVGFSKGAIVCPFDK
ncbi:MAG: hypothetical protein KatS3mg119_1324 [Rhodothalassiaceae bacterium]|nr:MAG: hypothetical protein KatS3mg119_1324 [Rhodothalassiaceae bacterium]